MRAILDELIGLLGRALLGFGAAFLPRRLWDRWDGSIPITAASLPAALLTFFLAFAIGVPGFLEYAAGVSALGVDAAVEKLPQQESAFGGAIGMSALALFMFLFLTPKGWLSLYLGTTGLLRLASYLAGDPFGDPILTGLERRASASAQPSATIQPGACAPGWRAFRWRTCSSPAATGERPKPTSSWWPRVERRAGSPAFSWSRPRSGTRSAALSNTGIPAACAPSIPFPR